MNSVTISRTPVLDRLHEKFPEELRGSVKLVGSSVFFDHRFCNHIGRLDDANLVLEIVSRLESKGSEFDAAVAQGDFVSALQQVEHGYRPATLLDFIEKEGVGRLFPLVGDVWCDSGSTVKDWDVWEQIWGRVTATTRQKVNPLSWRTMNAVERRELKALPEQIQIFRGFSHACGKYGWSWTTDRSKAVCFARWFADEGQYPQVASLTIKKRHVLAYFTRYGEDEIVVYPDTVDFEETTIEPAFPVRRFGNSRNRKPSK